jgi:glycosyltransferase involved in cell wall biosynthesis
MTVQGSVAVLACVYNGEPFLGEQLESLAAQSFPRIDLILSDDGSTDGSREHLATFGSSWRKGRFEIVQGPGKGFAENFRSQIVNETIEADYFAFCDQDDIWEPEKLSTAIAWLAEQRPDRPALYCSRTRIVDIAGKPVAYSPLFAAPPSFRNAIVQSIAGGNTMVMNAAARRLMAEASRRSGFVSHDWWCYMIVTGAGGAFRYDPNPLIGYRQHQGNLVGSNDSILSRLGRSTFLLRGGFAAWTDRNIAGLRACEDLLDDDARRVLDRFERLRRMFLPRRLVELHRSGVYRQTKAGQISLYIASAINRL